MKEVLGENETVHVGVDFKNSAPDGRVAGASSLAVAAVFYGFVYLFNYLISGNSYGGNGSRN